MHRKTFISIKRFILLATVFLFPLFFLPLTQEFYTTNKMYLLAGSAILLLTVSLVEFIATHKIEYEKKSWDMPIFLLILAVGLSVAIPSPNKIQALLNPNFGLLTVASLAILYFFASRILKSSKDIFDMLSLSAIVLTVLEIAFFFVPFKTVKLPVVLQFLQNPLFTPMGTMLDLAVLLGFVTLYQVMTLYTAKKR